MKTIGERLRFAIENKGLNPNKVSVQTNVHPTTIKNYLDNKGKPDSLKLDKIASFLDVDYNWLLSGEGDMVKEKGAGYVKESPKHGVLFAPKERDIEQKNLIPLYDGVITASMVGNDLSPESYAVEFVDAGDWFRDATAAMRVHGDSMHPEYKSGSIVALKKVENKRLVIPGQDYVIETSEYRVIKRLQRSSEKNSWLACSINTEIWDVGVLQGRLIHEPFDINMDDVIHLYQVLGNVKRNSSSRIVKV